MITTAEIAAHDFAVEAVNRREHADLPLTGDWSRAAMAISHGRWIEARDHVYAGQATDRAIKTLIDTFVIMYRGIAEDGPQADTVSELVAQVEKTYPGFTDALQVELDADADNARATAGDWAAWDSQDA